jgi:hypothetical protein
MIIIIVLALFIISIITYLRYFQKYLLISEDKYDLPDGVYHAKFFKKDQILIHQYNRDIYGTLRYAFYGEFKGKIHIKNKRIIKIEE